mgnify:CR=1 FL=1
MWIELKDQQLVNLDQVQTIEYSLVEKDAFLTQAGIFDVTLKLTLHNGDGVILVNDRTDVRRIVRGHKEHRALEQGDYSQGLGQHVQRMAEYYQQVEQVTNETS